MMKKMAYFVHEVDDGTGVAVVATSHSKAKVMALNALWMDGVDYIDLRAQQKKGVKIDDLEVGYVFEDDDGLKLGLERGLYSHVEGIKCPICGFESDVTSIDKAPWYCCNDCENKIGNEEEK